jgi:NAD(P)H dehydrogenase (quinone)
MAKVAVIYYSATGTVHSLAQEYAAGAAGAGAEVRVRRMAELAPAEAIASNETRQAHHDTVKDQQVATAEDVQWADAVVFGSPTRFGNVTAQLKQFIDTLGRQWAQGLLADKVYSGFTSTSTTHGGHESTLLALYNSVHHFGGILVTPGYTDPIQFVTGTPYVPTHTASAGSSISDDTKASARYAGGLIAAVAGRVHEASAEVVDSAVRAARRAVDGVWGRCPATERVRLLRRIADLVDERFDDLLAAEVADTGKPAPLAAELDITRAAANFRAAADIVAAAGLDSFLTDKALNYAIRKPVGVVAVRVPADGP